MARHSAAEHVLSARACTCVCARANLAGRRAARADGNPATDRRVKIGHQSVKGCGTPREGGRLLARVRVRVWMDTGASAGASASADGMQMCERAGQRVRATESCRRCMHAHHTGFCSAMQRVARLAVTASLQAQPFTRQSLCQCCIRKICGLVQSSRLLHEVQTIPIA